MRSYDPEDLKAHITLNEVQIWLEDVGDALEDGEYEPTAWEAEFLESITDRLEVWIERVQARPALLEGEDQPLTGKQLVSLRQLWDKVTGEV